MSLSRAFLLVLLAVVLATAASLSSAEPLRVFKNLFFYRNIYYPFNCIENSALLTRKNAPGLSAPDPGPSADLKGWVHHDRTKWQRMTLCCRSHFFPFRPAAMSGAASSAPALCHLASCLVKKEGEEGEHATGNNLPTKKSKCLSPAIRTWPSVFWNETKTRKKFPSCVGQKNIFFVSQFILASHIRKCQQQ